ncbi:hypothetical protein B0H10DRAFT_2238510 [Mycena sp. CBHHK59/15]|nr:hypothetical protein B0H10DRAFT_2238510 [Mycena sp. CBHHK59/15]
MLRQCGLFPFFSEPSAFGIRGRDFRPRASLCRTLFCRHRRSRRAAPRCSLCATTGYDSLHPPILVVPFSGRYTQPPPHCAFLPLPPSLSRPASSCAPCAITGDDAPHLPDSFGAALQPLRPAAAVPRAFLPPPPLPPPSPLPPRRAPLQPLCDPGPPPRCALLLHPPFLSRPASPCTPCALTGTMLRISPNSFGVALKPLLPAAATRALLSPPLALFCRRRRSRRRAPLRPLCDPGVRCPAPPRSWWCRSPALHSVAAALRVFAATTASAAPRPHRAPHVQPRGTMLRIPRILLVPLSTPSRRCALFLPPPPLPPRRVPQSYCTTPGDDAPRPPLLLVPLYTRYDPPSSTSAQIGIAARV